MSGGAQERQKLLVGQDGWHFLHNDTNGVLDQLTGRLNFSAGQLAQWVRTIELRETYFMARGIRFGHFVVPDKEFIFADFLPGDIKPSAHGPRPIQQILSATNAFNLHSFHYLGELMSAHRHVVDLYRKLDTHWGFPGAYLAYSHMLKALFPERPEVVLRDVVEFQTDAAGDLGDKLDPPQRETTTVVHIPDRKSQIIYDNEVSNLGHITITSQANEDLPHIVIFHDSFANWLLPFMAESTSRLVSVHNQQLDYDLIAEEEPDAVIIQTIERFLIEPANDISGETVHEILKRKNADPAPWRARL